MDSSLHVAREDGVWTLTLARPEKRNALSAALVEALIEAVDAAEAAKARLLVFRGAGTNFSAGFDFTGYEAQSEGDLVLRFVRIEMLLQRVAGSACATLALVHGRNFGAGVDLVAACRYRVAAPGTTFRMPGLRFGLVLGSRRFAAIVGTERARRILEAVEVFDAEAGAAMGFVTDVVAQEGWGDVVAGVEDGLDDVTRAALYRVLDAGGADGDLAALVRSAARPGLKGRIAAYLG